MPVFAQTCSPLLWVGVRRYTRGYEHLLEQHGATCWTLDVDPSVARWGHPQRHLTCDLMELPETLDGVRMRAVLCNGVFGYGIDGRKAQAAALRRLASLIEPGGWLLIGWNSHRCADPLADGSALFDFDHRDLAGLSARIAVPGTTHVFDLLQRREPRPRRNVD